MYVKKYVNSEQYASVIETDRGLTINGTFIPYVVQNSVKCNDIRDGLHEVTLSFVTDSFIKLSGKPTKDYEDEHGYAPDYSFDGEGENMDKKGKDAGSEPEKYTVKAVVKADTTFSRGRIWSIIKLKEGELP